MADHASTIVMIPLDRLSLSELNVRKTEGDLEIDLLADSIGQRGLKQNLVVVPSEVDDREFEVVAGGRRYRALCLLFQRGDIDASYAVPCMLEEAEHGVETSLVENLDKISMNPADEFLAFRTIVEGRPAAESPADRVAYCARRFGRNARHIEQRLRLAALAEPILHALRENRITLDIAESFAATSDTVRQLAAWNIVSTHIPTATRVEVRNLLSDGIISSADRLARYVGRAAFVAAGGQPESDLFGKVDEERWPDRGLVERLAYEKLAGEAEKLKAKKGFADVKPLITTEPTWEQRRPFLEYYSAVPKERHAEITMFMVIDDAGKAKLHDAWYAPSRSLAVTSTTISAPAAGAAARAAVADRKEDVEIAPAKLSQALIDGLAMERRDMLAAAMLADPDLAYDAVVFRMSLELCNVYANETCIGVNMSSWLERQPVSDWQASGEPAAALHAGRAALDESWRSAGTMPAQFAAFRQIPAEAKSAWLAYAAGRSLLAAAHGETATGCFGSRSTLFDAIGAHAGVDVRRWWRPTAANYFSRITGAATLVAIAKEIGADVASWGHLKKSDLAERLEKLCAGELGNETLRAKGRAWVPPVMRFPKLPAAKRSRTSADAEVTA